MFDNPGRKLKDIAAILLVLGILGSIVGAIVLWSANSYRNPTILPGFLTLGLGILGSWLSFIALSSLGEAAESASEANYKIQELSRKVDKLQSALGVENTAPRHSVAAPSVPPTVKAAKRSVPGSWFCPDCGTENSNNVSVCSDCGTRKR